MSVTACFDESGKFKDHKVVCIGCVAGFTERFDHDFGREWAYLLHLNGLKDLSGKHVLRHAYPLSPKNPALGVASRISTLLPFIACIRKHLQVISAVALDAEAFKQLPARVLKIYGTDPAFMAFVRAIMYVAEFTPAWDRTGLVCDEDEATALPFYMLYRKVKKVWPPARKSLAGISFVNDRYFFGVQASDLVASLVRHETTSQLAGIPYDFKPLYEALIADPQEHERFLWNIAVAIGKKDNLLATANDILKVQQKDAREDEERIARIREFRQDYAEADESSPQRDQSSTGRGEGGEGAKAQETRAANRD